MILNGCCILNYCEQEQEIADDNPLFACPSCHTTSSRSDFTAEVHRRRSLPASNPFHIRRLEKYANNHQQHNNQHQTVYSVKLVNCACLLLAALIGYDAAEVGDFLLVRVRASSPDEAKAKAVTERLHNPQLKHATGFVAESATPIPSRNGRPLSRNFK